MQQDVRGEGERAPQHQQVARLDAQVGRQREQGQAQAVASATPIHALRPGAWRRSSAAASGTMTTDSPVMNPALAGVVKRQAGGLKGVAGEQRAADQQRRHGKPPEPSATSELRASEWSGRVGGRQLPAAPERQRQQRSCGQREPHGHES